MIYDNIKNYKRYKDIYGIGKVLETIANLDKSATITEPIIIEDKRVFINPVSLTSKNPDDCIYESHKKYIDIHYIVSGCEGISVQSTDKLTLSEDFFDDKDIGFYKAQENVTFYLHEGDFLICYPGEAHMVAMKEKNSEPAAIKKFVGKVIED